MRVLFDQGTPVPLRRYLEGHEVRTAFEQGWAALGNGELLAAAESEGFEVFVTTDLNLRYQQRLADRSIAVVVIEDAQWPRLEPRAAMVAAAVNSAFREATPRCLFPCSDHVAESMTSDGIETSDWNRIHELVVEIVNVSAEGVDDSAERTRLFEALDALQRKYGRLPSIVATRADFVESVDQRVTPLLEAFELATARGDDSNRRHIADSLARTYVEDLSDADRGRQWLDTLAACLRHGGDEGEIQDYEELEEAWARLPRP